MIRITIQDCTTHKKYYLDFDTEKANSKGLSSSSNVISVIKYLSKHEHIEKYNKKDECLGYKLVMGSTGKAMSKYDRILNCCDENDILYLMVDTATDCESRIPVYQTIGMYAIGFIIYTLINILLYFIGFKLGYLIGFILLILIPQYFAKDLRKRAFNNQLGKGLINRYSPLVQSDNGEAFKAMQSLNKEAKKDWSFVDVDGNYCLLCETENKKEKILLPNGEPLRTKYKLLADRILADLKKHGYDYSLPESVLTDHCVLNCFFNKLTLEEITNGLFQNILSSDWTIQQYDSLNKRYKNGDLIGYKKREKEIQTWLRYCSKMQLAAIYVLSSAYKSLNIAFCVAKLMEEYERAADIPIEKVKTMAGMFAEMGQYDQITLINDFSNFLFYYGIHYDVKGKIITNQKTENNVNTPKE